MTGKHKEFLGLSKRNLYLPTLSGLERLQILLQWGGIDGFLEQPDQSADSGFKFGRNEMSFRPDASNDKHNMLEELEGLEELKKIETNKSTIYNISYQRKMFSRGMFLKSKSSIDNF